MTTQRKIEVAGALIILALLIVFAAGWMQAREDNMRAAAKSAADETVKAAQAKDISDRDALAKTYSASLAAKGATITTPQAAVQVIEHYLPAPANGAAQQPMVQVQQGGLPAAVQAALPNAPSSTLLTVMTPAEVQAIAKQELSCDATANSLATCKADVGSLQQEVKAADDETAQWKAAAKGGSKWQRFGRAVKVIGCAGGGAGLGALVGSVSGAKDARSVALGAAAGGAGASALCEIF